MNAGDMNATMNAGDMNATAPSNETTNATTNNAM
jgi:hypothetical protein